MVFVASINVFLLFLCVWVLQSVLYLWPNCGVFFMFHKSYLDVKYEQSLEQVALHQLKVKERSVSVTMVWPYFTVLSYILERGRRMNIVPSVV